ncbi:MAG: hypothetical protein HY040_03630 [Planctomycetes bacterium]|nr:hypothetical protein [Planctomycetota bacterium]
MFSNLEKKWMQEFKHSPNGRHAAGISRPNQLLWFDFVTGEESRVDLGDVEISHCHFSPRGDFLSVLLEKRPSKVVNVYSAETRELHLSVDVDPNSSPGFLPKSNNHVHTISENGLPFTRIWDLDAKWEIARISGRTSVSLIGPDGKWLITEEAKAKWTRHFFPQSKKTSRGIGYDPKSDVKDMVCVVEMNTHQEVFRLEDEPAWFASLSPKGNTLLVVTSVADEIPLLTCWDIPARRPWPWILGIPFGFFALLLSVRWLLARRIRRKAQVARPATLSG